MLSRTCPDSEPEDRIGQVKGQRSREGIIRVQAKNSLRHLPDSFSDRLQRMHNFAVAVQLVAKKIGDNNHSGAEQRNHLVQSPFVAFNHCIVLHRAAPPVRASRKLRSHTGEEICAGAVRCHLQTGMSQCALQHGRGSGLAIGPRHHDADNILRHYCEQILFQIHSRFTGK